MPLDACKVDVGFLIFKLPATSSGWSPGVRPNRPFGDVAAKGSNEAVSGRSDPAQLHAFWGIDVTCGELSPFRKTQAQAVGRVKKKTQLPRASRSVIINSAFSVRSGHFLCKN